MANDLFDFINTMFSKPEEFKKTSLHDRGKYFFMCNRFCAIKYPVQAAYINHLKIHPGQAVTFWQELLGKMYTKTPSWMYVKVNRKKNDKSELDISEETLNWYCGKNQISRKVLDEAIKFIGKPMITELQTLEQHRKKNS